MVGSVFAKDVLLDKEEFKKASERFEQLSNEMTTLQKDVEKLLDELRIGFDTPAGRKFVISCKNGLIQPMKDQAVVIKHVSENLNIAQAQYESVFTEFAVLNNFIKN